MRDALKNSRYVILPIAAVALLTGVDWLANDTAEVPVHAADLEKPGFGPASYAAAMARSDSDVSLGKERVSKGPDEWLRHESLARMYLGRSHLSYTYDELALAGEALTKAKRLAPEGSGPLLTDAAFAQMSHQLDRTQNSLSALDVAAVRSDPAILAESSSLRGDIAFYRGDMARARALYEDAAKYGLNSGVAYRFAILAKSRGEFETAVKHFSDAVSDPGTATPFANASAAMQIGAVELARGDYRNARAWFESANRQFSGFWLIEAHLAQAKALEGDLAGAIIDMKAVARRAPAGEVLDALAMLLRADGQARESRLWANRASAIWTKRLDQLPEAAYGHAIEHELVFGSPDKALDLAKRNFDARPYGESRILLASAYLSNGIFEEAVDQLNLAERSGWRSAPLYALLAQAHELSGRPREAAKARKAAEALNPKIFEPETSMVWLSHG